MMISLLSSTLKITNVCLGCSHLFCSTPFFYDGWSFDEFLVIFPASREKSYKQIEAAIAKFREIKDNINEGLKFYVTLQVRPQEHTHLIIYIFPQS
jgi:hypothetical protein